MGLAGDTDKLLRSVDVKSTAKVMVKYVNLGWTNNLAKALYEDESDSEG